MVEQRRVRFSDDSRHSASVGFLAFRLNFVLSGFNDHGDFLFPSLNSSPLNCSPVGYVDINAPAIHS